MAFSNLEEAEEEKDVFILTTRKLIGYKWSSLRDNRTLRLGKYRENAA